jgi:hypothetical protein
MYRKVDMIPLVTAGPYFHMTVHTVFTHWLGDFALHRRLDHDIVMRASSCFCEDDALVAAVTHTLAVLYTSYYIGPQNPGCHE